MDATPAQPSTSNDDPKIEEEEVEETAPPVKTRKPYTMSPAAREARRLNAQKPRKKVPVDPNQAPPEPIEPAEPPPPRRKRGRPRKHPIEERGTSPDPTPAEDLAELIKEVSRVAVDERISEMAGAISAEREELSNQPSDSKGSSSSSSSPRWLALAAIGLQVLKRAPYYCEYSPKKARSFRWCVFRSLGCIHGMMIIVQTFFLFLVTQSNGTDYRCCSCSCGNATAEN